MILRVCPLTPNARRLAERIVDAFPEDWVETRPDDATLEEWFAESFAMNAPTVFIGACGIAVRKLAPLLRHKATDGGVVVVDELGRFAIPILSGHLGGANRLAKTLAERIGAIPVVTTATELHGLLAIDVFAAQNAMTLSDPAQIVKVSSKLLREGFFEMAIEPGIEHDRAAAPPEARLRPFSLEERVDVAIASRIAPQATLTLIPKRYVLGLGCKKGIAPEVAERFVASRLDEAGLTGAEREFAAIASVDLKKREYALVYYATKARAPYLTYSASELSGVVGDFSDSAFVREVVGVGSVCERAAILAAGEGAELLVKKQSGNGVTMAIARRKASVKKWQT